MRRRKLLPLFLPPPPPLQIYIHKPLPECFRVLKFETSFLLALAASHHHHHHRHHHHLRQPEDQLSLCKSLSHSEGIMNKRQQYERVFDHFDTNGDKKISPSELRRCVEAIGGELSTEEAEAAVGMLDADGDGMLGFDEFVKLVEGGGDDGEENNGLKEAFKMYMDFDYHHHQQQQQQHEMEDGCITPGSLKRMLSRLGQAKSFDECKVMIAHFDLNGDGVLNFDEFRIMMML